MKIAISPSLILSSFALAAMLPFSTPVEAQQGHVLEGYYNFDNSGYAGQDNSNGGNDINDGSSWADSGQTQFSTNAIAGGGALLFDGGESLSSYPPEQTFDNWMAMYYGSFSVSLWLNTTNTYGNNSDALGCCNGATIIEGYNNGVNDTVPVGLTGSKVAFYTGDSAGDGGDTLHSQASVTTGNYVHVVVTRDQISGTKRVYVNGVLDSSDVGTTNHLNGDTGYLSIGGSSSSSYAGLLDDVQFYYGVLSASDVSNLYANPGTTVPDTGGPSTGLVAYYDFDEGQNMAADLSGNGNNLLFAGDYGPATISTNSISGAGAVYFDGGTYLTPSSNLLSTLASNFTVSVWIKTTQSPAFESAPAYYGAGIVASDVPSATNDDIPIALTGGNIGFNTGTNGTDDTLSSATDVNDGNYHNIVVTRNQATGVKQIFIDGLFSSTDTASKGLLNASKLITLGALADASNPDPTSPNNTGNNGYMGLLDDVQFYSRVLTSNEIAYIHAHPGSNVTNNLVCHYDFDEGTVLAVDVSGHSNNIVYAGSFGGPGPALSSNSKNGAGAVSFTGNTYLVPEGNLVSILSTNFSIAVWLNTTQIFGTNTESPYNGAGIITAGASNQNDILPLTLTGSDVSFGTGGSGESDLTSTTAINNGVYHHVVVTRDQTTGIKQIYIDGILNTSSNAGVAVLDSPQFLVLGCQAQTTNGNPSSVSSIGTNGYIGLMDDLQIYSRVISANEVAFLYNNPGNPLPVNSSVSFGAALSEPNYTWTTSGNSDWFTEDYNTYGSNVFAAESGSLLEGQSSVLQTTVNGSGIITFYWESSANSDDFILQFSVDGNVSSTLSGNSGWNYNSTTLGAGTHTLAWTASTMNNGYGFSSTADAGYLDQVSFGGPPVITLNPFSQTNYPGYAVALEAAASGSPTPMFQWYKVGNSTPIPGATNALFIPTNSGSSSVAGSYYAVASNSFGTSTTSTALVTFVTGILPPDWVGAFRSPTTNNIGTFTTNYLSYFDTYYGCTLDATGTNIITCGVSSGTNTFITNKVTASSNGFCAVIVKETAGKVPVWSRAVTNTGNGTSYCEAIAPGPNNGVYVTGDFIGTNYLGTNRLINAAGTVFLTLLDSNGAPVWVQTLTATNGVYPYLKCLVTDSSNNVTIGFYANSGLTIAGTNVVNMQQSGFVAQFNSAGALNWLDPLETIALYLQYGSGIIYCSLDNEESGNTNFTLGGLSNTTTNNNWGLLALNATNGHGLYVRAISEAKGNNPSYVLDDVPAISVSGTNVFLVGTAYGTNASFGSYNVSIPAGRGQYFARYDTNGNAQLAVGFGSSTTAPYVCVADSSGNVYVDGDFDTYSVFGSNVLAAPRYEVQGNGYFGQAFAAKFDRNGNAQWARMAESTNTTYAASDYLNFYDMALNQNTGLLFTCGVGDGMLQFGTNTIYSTGNAVTGSSSNSFEYFTSGVVGILSVSTPVTGVTLLNPVVIGTNFEFSFYSTLSHTNYVQYSTNLNQTNWIAYTNYIGDGTLKTVILPKTTPAAEFFRVTTH